MSEVLGWLAFVGLIALVGLLQEARRRRRIKPPMWHGPILDDPLRYCQFIGCGNEWTTSTWGWRLCADHSPDR